MKDKGLLWSVGGKDGVDAPRASPLPRESRRSAECGLTLRLLFFEILADTWKGISALQLVSTSPYTPLRHFILELLLLNLEQPQFSSIQPALKHSCSSMALWAKDVARRVVDSRGQSGKPGLFLRPGRLQLIAIPSPAAVKAQELLALTDDGSAASWIDANLPPCPTPDEQLTGFKALPPPPSLSAVRTPNGLTQSLADEARTPSPPIKLDLPVVKVVPPTPQAAIRVANISAGDGAQPPPVDHGGETVPARASSGASEDSLRVASQVDRASPVEEGEIRLTFSSDFEAKQAELGRELQPGESSVSAWT